MIYFIEDVGSSPSAQNVALRDLPLRDVGQHFPFTLFYSIYVHLKHKLNLCTNGWRNFQILFVSEKLVIGVGFDCNPMVFTADETGLWYACFTKLAINLFHNISQS